MNSPQTHFHLRGDFVTVTATPEAGYYLQALSYTTLSGTTTAFDLTQGTFSFTMPAEPVAVNAVFAGNTYQIAFAEDMEHGTLTAPETAVCGSTVTITPQPDAGYMLDTLTAADANGQLRMV